MSTEPTAGAGAGAFAAPHEAAAALRAALSLVEHFVWSVPEAWVDRTDLALLRGLPAEDRSVRVLVAHLAVYEARLAVVAQRHLAGVTPVPADFRTRMTPLRPEIDALARASRAVAWARLAEAVHEHAELVARMTPETLWATGSDFWNVDRWGVRESAGWVCAKSVEHLLEHGYVIARVALFHDVLD